MSLALSKREKALEIYGPNGIKKYIKHVIDIMHFDLTYPLKIVEIDKEVSFEFINYKISCFPLEHRILTLGFAIIEKPSFKFDVEKAKLLNIPKGPLWGKLKSGKSIRLNNGIVIQPSQVLGSTKPGKKILYCTDTRPTTKTEDLSKNADILIHDGMFEEDLKEFAVIGGHSTVVEAAELAKKANVKKLILFHISSRYENNSTILELQAKEIFPNSFIAEDFLTIVT